MPCLQYPKFDGPGCVKLSVPSEGWLDVDCSASGVDAALCIGEGVRASCHTILPPLTVVAVLCPVVAVDSADLNVDGTFVAPRSLCASALTHSGGCWAMPALGWP